MATALQLVNRVRRLLRFEDTSDLTDDLSVVLLDLVNQSKRDVLETRLWPFDERDDGIVHTFPALSTGAPTISQNAVAFTSGTITAAESQTINNGLARNPALRFVIDSDSDFGNTSFRVVTATLPSGSGTIVCTSTPAFPGATATATSTYILFAAVYGLPATVRQVLSVTQSERPLKVDQVSTVPDIDTLAPRIWEDTSDTPDWVAVGGRITRTYVPTESEPDAQMAMTVFPAPSSEYFLQYRYTYRHPDLSSSQDLDDVDTAVEDLIVRDAYAEALMTAVGNDFQRGQSLKAQNTAKTIALHQGLRRQPFRRAILQPLDRTLPPHEFGRLPKNFGSL